MATRKRAAGAFSERSGILDVDVTDVDRTLSQNVIREIAAVEHHHGHVGPVFVERLVAAKLHHNPDALRDRVMDYTNKPALQLRRAAAWFGAVSVLRRSMVHCFTRRCSPAAATLV